MSATVLISTEGQTEETFVRDVLAPHLATFGVTAIPVVLATKRPASGGKFRGGVHAWPPILREIELLLGDTHAVAVTTMLDLYALPADVPGVASTADERPYERVAGIESALRAALDHPRFRPYVQLHEFEALIFAGPQLAATRAGDPAVGQMIESAVAASGGAEHVNEGPTTAPSKRIRSAWPGYVKTIDGPALAAAIGLAAIADSCPHFGEWLRWLESLGDDGPSDT